MKGLRNEWARCKKVPRPTQLSRIRKGVPKEGFVVRIAESASAIGVGRCGWTAAWPWSSVEVIRNGSRRAGRGARGTHGSPSATPPANRGKRGCTTACMVPGRKRNVVHGPPAYNHSLAPIREQATHAPPYMLLVLAGAAMPERSLSTCCRGAVCRSGFRFALSKVLEGWTGDPDCSLVDYRVSWSPVTLV